MSTTVHCARCGRPEAPALVRQPYPGKLGVEIRERICADCWAEWQKMEVMVINELRLNFMEPAAQETLSRHMKEFLFSGGPEIGKNPDPR
jgi:Fe-S cluster biosynthesis and repair protein YggX